MNAGKFTVYYPNIPTQGPKFGFHMPLQTWGISRRTHTGARIKLDRYLAENFPNCIETIRVARSEDTEFDEICRDFEEIASELSALPGKQPKPEQGIITDLISMLNSLREEILDALNRISKTLD